MTSNISVLCLVLSNMNLIRKKKNSQADGGNKARGYQVQLSLLFLTTEHSLELTEREWNEVVVVVVGGYSKPADF